MVRVMMAAPFQANGRFQGGIHFIANNIADGKDLLKREGIELIPFETCRIPRRNHDGQFNLENLKNFRLCYRDAEKEARKAEADVFYLHSSRGFALVKDLLILQHVKKSVGCRTVLHIHFAETKNILTGKQILDMWVVSTIRRYVDDVVFLSRQTKEDFLRLGVSEAKCHVIYNFSTLAFDKNELFADDQKQKREFLFMGSIDNRKGVFDFLEIFRQIREPYTLHVCGSFRNAENEGRFDNYRKILGEKLCFHGFASGDLKRELFRKADVLLLPSYQEGLPIAILEALSAGCSVISSTVGAIPEVISEENGILIHPGDMEALRDAIVRYIHISKEELQQQKEENYKLAENYTLDSFLHQVEKVCKRKENEKNWLAG